MTEYEEIERLKTTVPKIELTFWGKVERAVGWLFGVVAIAALVLSLAAAQKAAATAGCINTNLGVRSAPTAADAKAHVALADILLAAVTQQTQLTTTDAAEINTALGLHIPANRTLGQDQLVVIVRAYKTTLQADQAHRAASPLGKC